MSTKNLVCPCCFSKNIKHDLGQLYKCKDCGAVSSAIEYFQPVHVEKNDIKIVERMFSVVFIILAFLFFAATLYSCLELVGK